MKSLIIISSLALLAGPVLADEVIIKRSPDVIEHRAADDGVTTKKTVRHGADGCDTKSVTKSNGEGDAVTKTKSNCD